MFLIFILNRCNVNSINNIANDIDAIIINTIESDNISGKKVIENPKQNIPDILPIFRFSLGMAFLGCLETKFFVGGI